MFQRGSGVEVTISEPYASCRKPCLILSQARQAWAHRCQKMKKPGFKSSRQHHGNLKINLMLTSGGRNGHCCSIPVLHGTMTSSRHAFSGATRDFFALLPVALGSQMPNTAIFLPVVRQHHWF